MSFTTRFTHAWIEDGIGGRFVIGQGGSTVGWYRVSTSAHLQLSAVNPPDARVPGPVIGPGSRVRPYDGNQCGSEFGVLCLDVVTNRHIDRGDTFRRMVSMTPERTSPFKRGLALMIAVTLLMSALAIVVR